MPRNGFRPILPASLPVYAARKAGTSTSAELRFTVPCFVGSYLVPSGILLMNPVLGRVMPLYCSCTRSVKSARFSKKRSNALLAKFSSWLPTRLKIVPIATWVMLNEPVMFSCRSP